MITLQENARTQSPKDNNENHQALLLHLQKFVILLIKKILSRTKFRKL